VQWGLGAALIVAAIMTTRNRAKLHRFEAAAVHRLVLEGSITFLSAIRFDALRAEVAQLPRGATVILDLSDVDSVDSSGGEYIADFANYLLDSGLGAVLLGMAPEVQQRVLAHDHQHRLMERLASSEADVPRRLPRDQGMGSRLTVGVAAYRRKQLPRYQALFETLAKGQHPHALFVTCADSRIVPNLITDSAPGELFIMRNVGNMVPPFNQQREMPASGAGVDYAVGVLKVSDIVVCGHSRCGAIGALRHPENVPANLTSLRNWLSEATSRKMCQGMPDHVHDDDVARANTVLQIENLRTYAIVREQEAKGELTLAAWFFDIGSGELESYNFGERRWERVGEEPRRVEPVNEGVVDPAPAPSVA
ncbi:MAG TPA: carbonic anhydrase, partial [Polyangiales bacterium]